MNQKKNSIKKLDSCKVYTTSHTGYQSSPPIFPVVYFMATDNFCIICTATLCKHC